MVGKWWARRDALEKQVLFVVGACAMIVFVVLLTVSAATGHWEPILAYTFVVFIITGLFSGIIALFKLAEKIFPND